MVSLALSAEIHSTALPIGMVMTGLLIPSAVSVAETAALSGQGVYVMPQDIVPKLRKKVSRHRSAH